MIKEIPLRILALLMLILAASLLLSGCGKARERREAREAAVDATETVQAQNVASAAPNEATPTPEPTTAPARPTVATALPAPPVASSAGCGTAAQRGSSIASLESDGIERSYRLYVPAAYEPDVPAALVINYHGLGSNALEQERYSGYPAAADEYGFVVVTPEGTGQPREWYLYGPIEAGYVDDFAFTDRLIGELSAQLCIDKGRIYATGISNGGGMTSLAGCELNDRLAAIAPVAGSPYAEARCAGKGPMPIVAFHGTEDRLVPFEPGIDTGRLDLFNAGVRNNMLRWATHNGCDLSLQTQRIADDVVLESYGSCEGGADVELYVVEGGGHTWPGATRDIAVLGSTTHSISATEIAWRFFAEHAK